MTDEEIGSCGVAVEAEQQREIPTSATHTHAIPRAIAIVPRARFALPFPITPKDVASNGSIHQTRLDNRTYVRYAPGHAGRQPVLPRIGSYVNHEKQTNQQLISTLDTLHRQMCRIQVDLFSVIASVEQREAWRDDGARDMAHWLWMRFGISAWKAARWIAAARALPELPCISQAFARGELGIDQVVELTRFATPNTESDLVRWAQTVSSGAIRRRGDREARISVEETVDIERARSLSWWFFDDGRRFGLEAELPASQGAIVAKALERVADSLPEMPDEDDPLFASARRADAFVGLCSARIASDPDQDRATIVVHAKLHTDRLESAEIEGGPPVQRRALERLACNARVQTVVENASGDPIGVGRLTRVPPDWMTRQIRHRDQECRFPGCGARRFTQAHHISFWRHGGRTDPENLVLICSFHHRLVHEYGWRITRTREGDFHWFRSDGTRYRAGPGRARSA